ncbi:2-dehydro-3-deoxy-D-gluconate 5-dehydrogenase KduD [Phycisphaerales bacterium AB-hyl4]|uniref:2-dehydro-3-deoxy-D-gluconate 5-dehydrogenase KduD n=1 Tax=Natronomicrosphaera hydrolytica TaxID=3242702 RepID=A0ABV4U9T2_9BACT
MSLDTFKLDGQTALVSGVATGLGQAIAEGLAAAGADIVGVYHTTPPDHARQAVEATGRRFVALQGDLGQPATMAALVERALGDVSRIDILVNNAGIIRRAELLEFTETDWDDVIDVNLKSLFLLSQSVARHMVERGEGGKIINIASLLSYQGGIRVPSYTASKHGVLGLTRLMANELAPKGINVNAIAPGYIATANTQALRDDQTRNAQILERIPAGRWGVPDDLKGAAIFLASTAARYLHGSTLTVDGGWLAR